MRNAVTNQEHIARPERNMAVAMAVSQYGIQARRQGAKGVRGHIACHSIHGKDKPQMSIWCGEANEEGRRRAHI